MAKLPRSEKRALTASKRGVVAMDFDGVIGDSVFENYVLAVSTYKELGGRAEYSPEAERAFRQARPLITKAEHYATIMRLIEQNPHINFSRMTQAQMNAEFVKDKVRVEPFLAKYYVNRTEMQTNSREKWLALQKSYPGVPKLIASLRRRNQIFIATTKNRDSLVELLKRYGVQIPEQNLVTVEFSKDKRVQLQEIAKRAGVPIKKVVLVDDALEQMNAARQVGAKSVMFTPGYSMPIQRKEARLRRIPMIGGLAGVRKLGRRDVRKINRMVRG